TVLHSVRFARRERRWERQWYPRRERARRTTSTDAIWRMRQSCNLSPELRWRAMTEPQPMTSSKVSAASFGSCPLPISDRQQIVLGHGSGGKLTADLIDQIFLPAFRNPILDKLNDQAVITAGGARLAFTTDSFVVTPIFFPGGDIGRLAVNGTVNDLAMSG